MKFKISDFVKVFIDNPKSKEQEIIQKCFEFLKSQNCHVHEKDSAKVNKRLTNILRSHKKRWTKASRNYVNYKKKFREWLETAFEVDSRSSNRPRLKGRPQLPFYQKCQRGQRFAIAKLSSSAHHDFRYLLRAALYAANQKNEKIAASRIQDVLNDKVQKPFSPLKKVTPEDAFSLIIDADLTVKQYLLIRIMAFDNGTDIFPAYHRISAIKKSYRPANISCSASKASVPLQDLLNHTSRYF